MPTVAAMSVIVAPSVKSNTIRARLAMPAGMVSARCQARSAWRCAGVRRIVREVLRPRGIQTPFIKQWSGQKSGGDSAVRPEFVIAGMIFHPSRVQSELLHKYIEQSFVEVTLLPARHREDVWLLTLRHAQVLSAPQIEHRQRSVAMKVSG